MTHAVRDILNPAELLIILLLAITALEPTAIRGPRETGPPAPPVAYDSTMAATSPSLTTSTIGYEVDLTTSISHIEECRDIHLIWIRIMKANPERYANQTKYIGDVEYHQEWVEKYNLVLKTLNEIKTQIEVNRRQ